MKYETNHRLERIPTFDAIRRVVTFLFALALAVGAAVVAGLAYVYSVELLGAGLVVVLVGWVVAIGIAVMLPFLVVRVVATILTALRL